MGLHQVHQLTEEVSQNAAYTGFLRRLVHTVQGTQEERPISACRTPI